MDNLERLSKTTWFYPLLISGLFWGTYIYIFDTKFDLNGDNAAYYILGQSIADGQGYTNIHSIHPKPHNVFPPGYPFIISVIITTLTNDRYLIKIFNAIFFWLTLLVLFQLFMKITDNNRSMAFVATVFLAINYSALIYTTIMMSEMAFMLLCTLAITWFIKMDTGKKPPWLDKYFIFSLLTLGAAYYTRTAAIALLGGFLLYFTIKKRWKHMITMGFGFVLMALPWFIRSASLGGSSYLKPMAMVNPYRPELGQTDLLDLGRRFFVNFQRYITQEIPGGTLNFVDEFYPNLLLSTMGRLDLFPFQLYMPQLFIDWILGLFILLIIIYGFTRLSSQRVLLGSYLAGTFGILLLWPDVWVGTRFMLPVLPFLILFLVLGVSHFLGWFFHKRFFNPMFLLLLILISWGKVDYLRTYAQGGYPPSWNNYFAMADWVRKNTPRDAIICARKPMMFYLEANRKMTSYVSTPNQQELIDSLAARNVDYVVLEQLGFATTRRYLYPAIRDNPERFNLVLSFDAPPTWLMQFVKNPVLSNDEEE